MEPTISGSGPQWLTLLRMGGGHSGQGRRARRSNLWMAASLEWDGGTLPVTLRNLSAEGAMVEGDHGLAPGDAIVFCKDDLAVPGRVAWIDGRRLGLAFSASLDPESVRRQIPPPRLIDEFNHKRPGFRGRLIEQERRFGQSMWERAPPGGK